MGSYIFGCFYTGCSFCTYQLKSLRASIEFSMSLSNLIRFKNAFGLHLTSQSSVSPPPPGVLSAFSASSPPPHSLPFPPPILPPTAVYLDRLTEATDAASRADVAAVILQEGIAHLCLVTPNMTVVKQRIEVVREGGGGT